ncbi:hypothetical protein HKI87_06g42190 [Chloropicon roscoffensis]|uniref:Ankyrin repeat domain-containing protein n=1 Tax=Chloropicon roscoffensis TaxID=1461544 RepID=A0AAX4P8K0_9CHLO
MERARKYLYTRGPEHAMSFAIEDGQDLSVLRTLMGLGAKVWHTSWNVACYTGNFEVMEFLDNNGYWSEINTEAISCAIRAGQLEAAKWLRAHDPPAPWDMDVTNACVVGWAKAAGVSIRAEKDDDPNYESKEYQPGERMDMYGQQPKDLPQPLLQEMTDWLVGEGAPEADRLASEVKKLKEHMESKAARNSGGPQMTPEMLESMTDWEMNGVKLDPLLKKHGVDAHTIFKYLLDFGMEDAMSHAIEHREDLPVLRTLIELGAEVRFTSWNMACFTGNFKTIGFLERQGYWSEINPQAISFAIKGGQLKVAKWLRDHDPPAPWDHQVCDSVIAAGAKAAGFNIMMDSEEKSKEYKAGDPALAYEMGTIRNLQMPLIVEMADWLVSEGVPRADRLASEMKRLKTGLAMKAAMSEGNLKKAFSLMAETGNIPDRIQGVPFGIFLEKGGIEPHTIMGPTALSFGREAVSAFSPEQMKAAEQMQRAWKAKEHKKFLAISKESGLTPEKIGGVPYDPRKRAGNANRRRIKKRRSDKARGSRGAWRQPRGSAPMPTVGLIAAAMVALVGLALMQFVQMVKEGKGRAGA